MMEELISLNLKNYLSEKKSNYLWQLIFKELNFFQNTYIIKLNYN